MPAAGISTRCFVANTRVAFANREIPVTARAAGVAPLSVLTAGIVGGTLSASYAGNSGISPSPTPHLRRTELEHVGPPVLAGSLQAIRSKRKSAASLQR